MGFPIKNVYDMFFFMTRALITASLSHAVTAQSGGAITTPIQCQLPEVSVVF